MPKDQRDEVSKEAEDGDKETAVPGPSSRRTFLTKAGTMGLLAAVAPFGTAQPATASPAAEPYGVGATVAEAESVVAPSSVTGSPNLIGIDLKVNGKNYHAEIDPRSSLLDCLRETLHLTGTKKGCDHGQCGACTVHINGKRANSCLSLALVNVGDEITTIEGLGTPEKLDPMQAAFVQCDAYQCGYCTSGQIMSASALMKEPCGRADADVKELMSGNICRCGAYKNILDAIQQVRGVKTEER